MALSPGEKIGAAFDRGQAEICEDVANGVVPRGVRSFSELHDYVDANEYGGLCEDFADLDVEAANEVQMRLDRWIKAGRDKRLRMVV